MGGRRRFRGEGGSVGTRVVESGCGDRRSVEVTGEAVGVGTA